MPRRKRVSPDAHLRIVLYHKPIRRIQENGMPNDSLSTTEGDACPGSSRCSCHEFQALPPTCFLALSNLGTFAWVKVCSDSWWFISDQWLATFGKDYCVAQPVIRISLWMPGRFPSISDQISKQLNEDSQDLPYGRRPIISLIIKWELFQWFDLFPKPMVNTCINPVGLRSNH